MVLTWSSSASKDGKQVDEEIDDVDVEDDGSNDVVVNAQFVTSTSNDQLGVNQDVESHEADTEALHEWDVVVGVGVHNQGDSGQNHLNAEHKQESPAHEWSAHLGEVSRGEACIDRQGHCDDGCEHQWDGNSLEIIEWADKHEDVGPAEGESCQNDVVDWNFSSKFRFACNSDKDEELNDDAGPIHIPSILDTFHKVKSEHHANHSKGYKQLHCQDGVDLTHESHATLFI